ncbi:MAG: methyltransferase, partial [Planctomycetes bacterium]|nr:methyltransferase [Planctomycetota bacterium]
MKADSLPPAFALLENEPNTAADAALLEALPFLSPSHRAAALDILIRRAHVPSLARIVGRYHEFDDATRASVSKCAGELATGLRAAILTPEPQDQSNAVELIADGRESRTAYLLVEALRSRHASTRQRAGEVLHDMADRALSPGTASKQIAQVGEALAEAVGAWESHEQPKILEAAIRLGGRTESAIRRKLEGRRSTIGRTLRQMLATSTDPRSAGFVLRALADLHERGEGPELLRGIVSKAQIESLRFQSYPTEDYDTGGPARLKKAGITARNYDKAKQALEQLSAGVAEEQRAERKQGGLKQRIQEIEYGRGIKDFFQTPEPVARRMVEMADIQPGMEVLEPSAGAGAIASKIKEAAPEANLTVVEAAPQLSEILREQGFDVRQENFLERGGAYDRIVMNPPFSKGQD